MPRAKKNQASPEMVAETLRQSLRRDDKGKVISSTVVRFWELVAAKIIREHQDEQALSTAVTATSVLAIVKETGLPKNVIYGMANGTLAELPLWTVEPLCAYLGASTADLLGPRERRALNLIDAVMMNRVHGVELATPPKQTPG